MLSCPQCPVLKCLRHRGDVCCSGVFGTLVGVFVFSSMWSELPMTYAISCPMWSAVYNVVTSTNKTNKQCTMTESGVCVHISGED